MSTKFEYCLAECLLQQISRQTFSLRSKSGSVMLTSTVNLACTKIKGGLSSTTWSSAKAYRIRPACMLFALLQGTMVPKQCVICGCSSQITGCTEWVCLLTALIQGDRKIFPNDILLGVKQQEHRRLVELHNLKHIRSRFFSSYHFFTPEHTHTAVL